MNMSNRRMNPRSPFLALCGVLLASVQLLGCGGASGGTAGLASPMTPPSAGLVILDPPKLSFTDSGFSITDGITNNGFWAVSSADDIGWEYSLDFGKTWTRGEGEGFEVIGDGAKTIWVRARDELGNTSEVVVVQCTLDTMAPKRPVANAAPDDAATVFTLDKLESGGGWAYSVDQGQSWIPGRGTAITTAGNALESLLVRQQDAAGNASMPLTLDLPATGAGWRELSNDALAPSGIGRPEWTVLVHGEVVRGDPDYVTLEIPEGFRLSAAHFVLYESDDSIAFFAMQRAAVFDAGIDTSRMLSFGHFGPEDLKRNLVADLPAEQLTAGPLSVWIQQTGTLATRYVLELALERDVSASPPSSTGR
jgi:hypothetical protein